MSREARVLAQAKINVFLHVGPVYDGRFHLLATLFHRIDLADVLTVRVSDRDEESLRVDGPAMPPRGLGADEDNLAMRAARAFRDRSGGWPRGFSIEIEKRIPVGGGLGGGSADAGAVLRALNAMAPEPLPRDFYDWTAQGLGSDVPFLASDMVRALGLGRGEKLTDASDAALAPASVVLVVPPFGIPTADAYRWLDASGTRPFLSTDKLDLPSGDDIWRKYEVLGNDFEPVVEAHYPFIATARERLGEAGASLARMSGSGSTVFGIFPGTPPTAEELGLDATIVHTRVSDHVVPVEVRE
jgi:4-diphosphocytidyl-2-C-methyl-D-erythritol kinase